MESATDFLFFFIILEVAIAEAFNDEGNTEYRKGEYRYAIICYTQGININCKDENLNTILFTNRATASFQLGENCSVFFQSDQRPSTWALMFLECSILLTGNYHDALEDAKAARHFQPIYMKAIERGKV